MIVSDGSPATLPRETGAVKLSVTKNGVEQHLNSVIVTDVTETQVWVVNVEASSDCL